MKIRQTVAVAAPMVALSVLAPVQADASTAAASARTCYYDVVHIRDNHHLNVRSGPGLRYRVVARLPHNARHVPGDCRTHRADHRTWVHLTRPMGWADGHYLKRV
jgi:hypothetical protein